MTAYAVVCLVVALARPATAQQATSDTSSCTGTYTTPNTLRFSTDCSTSGSSGSSSDTNLVSQTSFEKADANECRNECALQRTLCYGIIYDAGYCYVYGRDLWPRNATGYKAIADAEQLTAPDDTACPYEQLSTQTTQDGQTFQILCNQDFDGAGGDYCPYETLPYKCYRHADSFEECLQLCSEAHPLCKGVTFNPDMQSGFGNCYFKTKPAGLAVLGCHRRCRAFRPGNTGVLRCAGHGVPGHVRAVRGGWHELYG